MNDITTRQDIDEIVGDFYRLAFADELIGFIFTDVAKLDLDKHIPVIGDFWEMMLLGTVNFQTKYQRSPMEVHRLLSLQVALKPEHFGRWVKLFCRVVDEKFAGPTATLAKVRAFSIAETMRLKFGAKNVEGVPLTRE